MRRETWDSFWARLLRVDFFAEPARRETYERTAAERAEWLERRFGLATDRPILSLACGEGGVEIALARRGFRVAGVDRSAVLIECARGRAAGLDATFDVLDLRDAFPRGRDFGAALCFDALGLMPREAEANLVRKTARALAPGGLLLVDSPRRETLGDTRGEWAVGDGTLVLESRWDPAASLQTITPAYTEPDGTRVGLLDPYDDAHGEHAGVVRYVYAPEEIAALCEAAGLRSEVVPHARPGSFLVAARRTA